MHHLIPFKQADLAVGEALGEKAEMLVRLQKAGMPVPDGYCLPARIYHDFLVETGLEDSIAREMQRKDFATMRWEEVWDVSLRIRNHFVTAPWPDALRTTLLEDLKEGPSAWGPVAVRSTAPGEDGARQSFAGLHESRVMVHGAPAILDAIRQVWASLWSDGALLYRQELGLDPATSGMAVLIQQMVVGERSGVLFTRAPQESEAMMVEAVWGLNQALVDGTLEPNRWLMDRRSGLVISKHTVVQTMALQPTNRNTELAILDDNQKGLPPIDDYLAEKLFRMGQQLEHLLGWPVDMEWTLAKDKLFLLQARPITTSENLVEKDERPWFLSLHRSLTNLESLRKELEHVVLPGMAQDAQKMAATNLAGMDNEALAEELYQRREVLNRWLTVYKGKCIPMAHGIRLFGAFYNDVMRPDDPYAFLGLLRSENLLAKERNRQLQAMAQLVRTNPVLQESLKKGKRLDPESRLQAMIETFQGQFGDIGWITHGALDLPSWLLKLALEIEYSEGIPVPENDQVEVFLDSLPKEEKETARRLLDVARASYALRDNDNLVLGKVRSEILRAEQEAKKRLLETGHNVLQKILSTADSPEALFSATVKTTDITNERVAAVKALARQMVGQPAGPGVATGFARILSQGADLPKFRAGEVLVCDAIEPNMTFLVPLAAAIVERRGGMLIHGAIIAREYGIPCVTGIHEATLSIHTGDEVTVDGYLGLVTVDHRDEG